MIFGASQRQDTLGQDAAPAIDPPALRVTPRDEVTQRKAESTGFEEGFPALGKSLGDAFQSIMNDRKAVKEEEKLQETKARQQLGVTVNKEDEKLKRTGWGLAFYGQNPQYALAQQMAVEQRIKQDVLTMNSEIDNYAEVHPTQFRDVVLKEKLNHVIKGYEEDPEMRTKLSTVWMDRVGGLVDNHYKSWFANSQKQIFERSRSDLLIAADEWQQNLNGGLNTGDEDQIKTTFENAKSFLANRGNELGQHPTAWRRAKLESTQVSLAEGNKNLYDLMKQTGELDNLTAGESRAMNTAVNAYDVKFRQGVDAMWADYEEDLLYTDNLEEGLGKIDAFLSELDAAKSRASGTEHSELTLQRGERSAARWNKKLRGMIDKNIKGLAKNEVKSEQFGELVDSYMRPQTLDTFGLQSQTVYTDTDRQKAVDEALKREVEALGVDVSDESTIAAQIIRNPDISEAVGKKLAKLPVKSKLMSNLIGSFANGWQNMFDESGRLSPDGGLMLQSVERLRANGAIGKYLTTEEAKDLEFVTTRIKRGQPAASIEKDFSMWKQSRTDAKSGVQPAKGVTQYQADLEHVNNIARRVYGQDLDASTRVELRDMYLEGLKMYSNNHNDASEYVRTRLENDVAIVNGQMVYGGSRINSFPVETTDRQGNTKTESIDLNTVINNSGTMLAPYFAAAKGLSPQDYQSKYGGTAIKDQPVRFYTQLNDDALYVDFVDGVQSVRIGKEQLTEIAEYTFKQQQIRTELETLRKMDLNNLHNYTTSW